MASPKRAKSVKTLQQLHDAMVALIEGAGSARAARHDCHSIRGSFESRSHFYGAHIRWELAPGRGGPLEVTGSGETIQQAYDDLCRRLTREFEERARLRRLESIEPVAVLPAPPPKRLTHQPIGGGR